MVMQALAASTSFMRCKLLLEFGSGHPYGTWLLEKLDCMHTEDRQAWLDAVCLDQCCHFGAPRLLCHGLVVSVHMRRVHVFMQTRQGNWAGRENERAHKCQLRAPPGKPAVSKRRDLCSAVRTGLHLPCIHPLRIKLIR